MREIYDIENLEIFKKDIFQRYHKELIEIEVQLARLDNLQFCEVSGVKQHGHIKTRTNKVRKLIKGLLKNIETNELNNKTI